MLNIKVINAWTNNMRINVNIIYGWGKAEQKWKINLILLSASSSSSIYMKNHQLNTYSHYIWGGRYTHTCCCINKRYEKSLLAYSSKNFIIIFYFILFPPRNQPENLLSFICSYNISSVNIRMTWIKERDPSLYFWIIPPSSSSSSLLKLYIFLYRIVHALAEINEYEQINEIKY